MSVPTVTLQPGIGCYSNSTSAPYTCECSPQASLQCGGTWLLTLSYDINEHEKTKTATTHTHTPPHFNDLQCMYVCILVAFLFNHM